jgi:hypothetical protein
LKALFHSLQHTVYFFGYSFFFYSLYVFQQFFLWLPLHDIPQNSISDTERLEQSDYYTNYIVSTSASRDFIFTDPTPASAHTFVSGQVLQIFELAL